MRRLYDNYSARQRSRRGASNDIVGADRHGIKQAIRAAKQAGQREEDFILIIGK